MNYFTHKQNIPGRLIFVSVLPFVTLSVTSIFAELFSSCREKKDKAREKIMLFSAQQSGARSRSKSVSVPYFPNQI